MFCSDFCVFSHCHLGENVWQNIFLVLRSECLWMKTHFSIEAVCQKCQCLISHEMSFEYCILKGNLLHEPLRQFLSQRSPWGAHLIKWSRWYKTLLWWDCCGEVAIQHCVICIQLKIQSNSFYKLYSKSKNVFRPVKIPLLSFLIGQWWWSIYWSPEDGFKAKLKDEGSKYLWITSICITSLPVPAVVGT